MTMLTRIFQLCGVYSACRGCGQEIWWMTTKNGKRMPFNPDGTDHWSTCPSREEFRKS